MPGRIHIATIHWPVVKWVKIQQYYLSKNISPGFYCYTIVPPKAKVDESRFEYTGRSPKNDHAGHLNHLQLKVIENAKNDNDILIFLDGDAFPIAPLDKYLEERLKEFSLIAIQRLENYGEYLPHPGFCAARVKFWEELGPVWGESISMLEFGKDPGGGLQDCLKEKGIEWGKIRRTNRTNMHPLFFGIYDNVLYHHGAGFREPISRIDMAEYKLSRIGDKPLSRMAERLPTHYFIGIKRIISPYRRMEYRIIKKNRKLQKEIFDLITADREFYRAFT